MKHPFVRSLLLCRLLGTNSPEVTKRAAAAAPSWTSPRAFYSFTGGKSLLEAKESFSMLGVKKEAVHEKWQEAPPPPHTAWPQYERNVHPPSPSLMETG